MNMLKLIGIRGGGAVLPTYLCNSLVYRILLRFRRERGG